MIQQHGRVVVDPYGAGSLQLLRAVSAREQADAEAPAEEAVPDAPEAEASDPAVPADQNSKE